MSGDVVCCMYGDDDILWIATLCMFKLISIELIIFRD